jgi:hypothetical protein
MNFFQSLKEKRTQSDFSFKKIEAVAWLAQ